MSPSKRGKGQGSGKGGVPLEGFTITEPAAVPVVTRARSQSEAALPRPESSKVAKQGVKGPKGTKGLKGAGRGMADKEGLAAVAEWEKFEKELDKKRKADKEAEKEARRQRLAAGKSSTGGEGEDSGQGRSRIRRALSVGGASELAAIKRVNRKKHKERTSEKLRELRNELEEAATEGSTASNGKAAPAAIEGETGTGRVRGWKVRMDSMKAKPKSREDYVSFYQGLQHASQDSSAFVDYYLALNPNKPMADTKAGKRVTGRKEVTGTKAGGSNSGKKKDASSSNESDKVQYYLTLHG